MAVDKIYSCNLCRKKYGPTELTGLKFVSPESFMVAEANTVEAAHICDLCIKQIANIYEDEND